MNIYHALESYKQTGNAAYLTNIVRRVSRDLEPNHSKVLIKIGQWFKLENIPLSKQLTSGADLTALDYGCFVKYCMTKGILLERYEIKF